MTLALAVAASACGLGPGPSTEGTATLTVTKDYGSEVVLEADDESPPESETVMRLLDREGDITTRYGGGFVQSVNGVEGTIEGGQSLDWFFYVNGIESSVGAAEVNVSGGDRIWWDYRDWSEAARVPAVVGSYPEPLAEGSVSLECKTTKPVCSDVSDRLEEAGAKVGEGDVEARVLVGPWESLRSDSAAAQLEAGPGTSGVFAIPVSGKAGWVISLLTAQGKQAGTADGLVAAVRDGDDAPTWLITGTDDDGVARAAGLLDEDDLRNHYAVALEGDRDLPVPAGSE
jgi:hypothetical protein